MAGSKHGNDICNKKGKLQMVKQKQKIFDKNHETWQLGIMKVPILIHTFFLKDYLQRLMLQNL